MKNKYLSADQVAEMRRCFRLGHKIVDLAHHFGVHPVVASRIVHYKTYKKVSDDAYPLGFDEDVGLLAGVGRVTDTFRRIRAAGQQLGPV